jgi:hypothetical protein
MVYHVLVLLEKALILIAPRKADTLIYQGFYMNVENKILDSYASDAKSNQERSGHLFHLPPRATPP